MHVAICDDEAMPRTQLIEKLNAWKQLTGTSLTIHEYSDGEALLFACGDTVPFDIVFLDIQMGARRDGIETATELRTLNDDMEIVFITNFLDYALRGYEVRAMRYLMKPVKQHDVDVCMDVVHRRMGSRVTASLLCKMAGREMRVPFGDIMYFEVFSHEIEMHTVDGQAPCFGKRMIELEQELPASFVRNHRSLLVNIQHVYAIKQDTLELDDSRELPISERRRAVVFEAFRKYRL